MKKSIIVLAAVSFLLVSCGGSRWSCKKRYCANDTKETKTEVILKTEQTALVTP